jgi:short-subunit dehydrogenase
VSALKEEKAMPVEACARLILAALERRQREVVMTAPGKLGRWLKLIAPGMVDRMARNAVKDDLRAS